MSDAPSPGRRPRPSPTPSPEPAAGPEATPSPETTAGPASSATPAAPVSRAARRTAERRGDQQARVRRLRRVMIGGLAVALVAGLASVVVALTGSDTPARSSRSASPSATASGAALLDSDRMTAFLAATTTDVSAVTTYDYRRLDDALTAGSSVTTGDYRAAFRKAMTGELAATARTDQVVHDFEVLDLGIGQMNAAGTQAKVLIFGRQLVTDRSHAQPQGSVLTLCATMVRRGDQYLIADLQQDTDPGRPSGSDDLLRAVEAGRAEIVNALTYTRASFDADLRRALAGAADPVRAQLQSQAEATRRAMTTGNYDLTGVVVASAVKSAGGNAVVLMVAAESSRVGGAGSQVSAARYEVNVTRTGGAWLVNRIQALPTQ